MSCCDDDFALLRDDAQSHHHHQQHQHHHVHHSQPAVDHQLPSATSPSFVTQRFGTPPKVGGTLPLHHHQHPHPHQHHQFHQKHHLGAGISSPNGKSLIGGPVAQDDDEEEDPVEDYGRAFVHAEAPKLPTQVAAAFHDVTSCFGNSTSNNPFAAPTQHHHQQQQPQHPRPPPPEEDDDCDNNNHHHHHSSKNNSKNKNELDHKGVGVAPAPAHHLDTTIKRKDRDELSGDGASPYCFPLGGAAAASKKPRPSSTSVMQQSSGDFRKDREEWSDSAIGCLLDAYTDKYIQLNRGNLRGRDWEEVATIVTDRCDKQKSGKSVEQCKNKVDNLKKRYKAERQRLSSGSLSMSHWPWFKKMEHIVGSSSSPSAFSKPIPDDEKSATAVVSAAAVGGSVPAIKHAKSCLFVDVRAQHLVPASLTSNLKMKALSNSRWKRVVLKISGAAFAGNVTQNVDPKLTMLIAREIAIANHAGVEVAVVVGGRNFFIGETWVDSTGIDRATAYQIGMMATVMNSVLLQASLEKLGVQVRVQTGFMMQEVAEPYIRRRAIRHLEKGRVVIFGGIGAGTGNPLFTTDTAAALRASEINADAVLKGINVDSVYDCHSRTSSTIAFEHISFRDWASRGFPGMDITAITFCEENNIPVMIFNLLEPGNISKALCGEQVGTLIDQSGGIS